jgi:uncharacterized protein
MRAYGGGIVVQDLIEVVRKEFALSLDGIHGASHWARVRVNGLRLAELTGANPEVVELFAFLHDSKRVNDRIDSDHGRRAAKFIQTLRGSLIRLPDGDFEHLVFACKYHSDGFTQADVTVQTCWDADRLDLGRIGIRPQACYLCTPAAREPAMIEWAFLRSQRAGHHVR